MTEPAQVSPESEKKPVHTIILDASPLLLNSPSISTLLANGHILLTTPSVLSEVRGEEARNRIETLYKPFLTVRTPKPESIKVVKEFARRTGDAAVLSNTDLEVLGLAYEVECERNGGDWRLRSAPGQKRVNGKPPQKEGENGEQDTKSVECEDHASPEIPVEEVNDVEASVKTMQLEDAQIPTEEQPEIPITDGSQSLLEEVEEASTQPTAEASDSDEGWITPSNIKRRQAKEESASSKSSQSAQKHLQVATMTGDFAMQNVLLQMNLNLLSTKNCQRISQIKQFILRCHACFSTTKQMDKQFCPRCGKPTLTRVSCTTNDKGEVKLHLKKNMQWNNKGNVFAVPKPTAGTANQKWLGPKHGGGGKGGWGNDLILAEDQKEYVRDLKTRKREGRRVKDLMDEDFLPGILSGDRGGGGGRVRVGAGRSINSRKR
ncbi:20S-pre-rRNA D-site endonuclease nob1 [Cladophialophora chaetospira]|uniref:20S-pre-rRNA D-site endonuclease NOB1 n=1 Tax=Cladophialophora chaetospira TaxID=386627 RepID=A0AA38XP95_9EURO|nr:20S-pre-rRNA D-site endonuclease nob1 [Cladophialophora chaetospira]